MNGYKVVVYKLTDDPQEEKSYNREKAEQVYEQKAEDLNLQLLIAVVNGLQLPRPQVTIMGGTIDIDALTKQST